MSEPVTPKVKKHIIEGDYTATSQKKSQDEQPSHADNSMQRFSLWRPQTFGQWLQLILAGLMVLILFYFVQQSQTQTQQVEAINRLQQQTHALSQAISQLKAEQKTQLSALQSELKAVQQRVETLEAQLLSPQHQPVVSQADVTALKQQVQTLQQKLIELSERSAQALQERVAQGAELVQSPEVQQQLNQLQQLMQQKLQSLGTQLKGLLESETRTEPETVLTKPEGFTPIEIQQWAVKINTQWQLSGNVEQTMAQLQALEQAVAASDLPNKMALIKAIGQDQVLLKQAQNVSHETLPSTEVLRQWLTQLTQIPEQDEPQVEEKDLPAQQRLMERFSQLFSVHKRQESGELTQAERVVLHDVLVQRGLLLADQLDWAVQTHSAQMVQKSVRQLSAFVRKYFPEKQTELENQLKPFKQLQFEPRPSLHIVEVL